MPIVPPKFYLVILFCGCRRSFPYFNSTCTAIHVGDVAICNLHQCEQVIKSVKIEEQK